MRKIQNVIDLLEKKGTQIKPHISVDIRETMNLLYGNKLWMMSHRGCCIKEKFEYMEGKSYRKCR